MINHIRYLCFEINETCYMEIVGGICMVTNSSANEIEEFIYSKLKNISPIDSSVRFSLEETVEEIYRSIMSAKFRRKSICDSLKQKIRKAIVYNVQSGKPINITFLQGCYKLWRFDESPEVDWAELFALMHYAEWIKPILLIYQPGVVFDFYVDDLIMERISNYKRSEILSYQYSFQKVIDFVMTYCPSNLHYKITTVSSQYSSEEEFWNKLDEAVTNWINPRDITLDASIISMIDLNYRPISDKQNGEYWREEIMCIHDAHSAMKERLKYREEEGKILAMPQHYSGADSRLFVGSTKDSCIKYWVGVGALRRKKDSYVTTVLSPKQLANSNFLTQNIKIKGLDTKNFSKIRILES